MRKYFALFTFLLMLTTVVGCGRGVDRRLVLADTLMWTAPDSSLAILNAINRDSLPNDESRAYHALLLTQAQFRNYITLTNDSLISTAVDYYSDNHNREHYTRALLYKGAAFEDMGNPVEAMRWYKLAEINADTTDYRNLANINLRMGKVYYNNFVGNNLDLNKFEKSNRFFTLLGDSAFNLSTLSLIGRIYRAIDIDTAIIILEKAKELSLLLNDTISYYDNCYYLGKAFVMDSNYVDAKKQCLLCVNNRVFDYGIYFTIANAYIGLGQCDSALYYINLPKLDSLDAQVVLQKHQALYNYFVSINDIKNADKYQNKIWKQTDSLEINKTTQYLAEVEKNTLNDVLKKETIKSAKINLIIVLSVFTLVLSLIVIIILYRKKTLRIIEDRNILKKQLEAYDSNNNIEILDWINHIDLSYDSPVSRSMKYHISVIDRLIKSSQFEDSELSLREINKIIDEYQSNTNIINDFESFINTYYNNFICNLKNNNALNKKYYKLIILLFLGFDDTNISVITGLQSNSLPSTYTRISKKMGINTSLRKYLNNIRVNGGSQK